MIQQDAVQLDSNEMLAAALQYASVGWSVFPCHSVTDNQCTCGKADCNSSGKHPRTANGLHDATTDEATIERWWQQWPTANIAIATGAVSGFVVIDIDPRHGGDKSFTELELEMGKVPPTVTVATGGGGTHYFFLQPDEPIKCRSGFRPGIDIKADGGYVIAAPSNHKDGGIYKWFENPFDFKIAPLPECLRGALHAPPQASQQPACSMSATARDNLLRRGQHYVANVASCAERTRANSAFSLAGHLAALDEAGTRLNDGEIHSLLVPWNLRNHPPLDEDELRRTIASSLVNGTPRAVKRGESPDLRPEHEKASNLKRAAKILRYRPFPTLVLPKPLKGFVIAAAKAIGCDQSYVALPLLTACAAAIGNSRRLRVKPGWTEPSILWTVIVGESGSGKTPPFKLALSALRERQGAALKRHAEAMAQHEIDLAHWEKEYAEWKRKIKDAGEPPPRPLPPVADRCLVSDCTVESLAPILFANPRGLLLGRDELAGWIGSFDRYAAKGGANAAHWLSMNSGENIVVDRKTGVSRTIYVPKASVSVSGGIQPRILARVLGNEHRESGLAARLLLAYPPRITKRWTDAGIDLATEKCVANLIERLYELKCSSGDDGEPLPVVIDFTEEARSLWIQFYNSHNEVALELEGDLSAAWSKLEAYCARLALVIHCIRWVTGDDTVNSEALVDAVSLTAAIDLIAWFKNEARRVYGMFAESDDERRIRELIELVERLADPVLGITANDLRRRCRWLESSEDAEIACNELVTARLAEWHTPPSTSLGGRPTRYLRLIPGVSVSETQSNADENGGLGYGDTIDEPDVDLFGDNPWGAEWQIETPIMIDGEEYIEL